MSNILFDIGHPAHVHLFKNLIIELKRRKHNLVITSREKDVTNRLLEYYGIDFISLSRVPPRTAFMAGELIKRDLCIYKLHKKHCFHIALGTSVSIAHLSALSNVKSYVFEEDDDDIVPLFSAITYPFATKIVIPDCLRYKRWKQKRIIHNSYHELAYLHPDLFSPQRYVVESYGLKPGQYVIMRISALTAHHDHRIKGLNEKITPQILPLFKDLRVIQSREQTQGQIIEPWDMHHVLSFSRMIISDSQTMTAEAACLGIPSIRYNSFVGRISYLEELEHKYKLTFGFRPGEEKRMVEKIRELINTPDLSHQWKAKQEKLLQEKVNFQDWLLEFVHSKL